jgi:hypothetical protein
MREYQVEDLLRDGVKKIGGKAYKFVSPGNAGVPDRVVILPGGHVCFVELKGTRGKLSPLQTMQISTISRLQGDVRVISSKEQVEEFLDYCKFIVNEVK